MKNLSLIFFVVFIVSAIVRVGANPAFYKMYWEGSPAAFYPMDPVDNPLKGSSALKLGVPDLLLIGGSLQVGGRGVRLSGGQYIALEAASPALPNAVSQSLSVEMWVKLSSGAGRQDIFSLRNSTSGFTLSVAEHPQAKVLQWVFEDGVGGNTSSSAMVTINTWTHLAVTLNGTNMTLYVNGISTLRRNASAPCYDAAATNSQFRIGAGGSGAPSNFATMEVAMLAIYSQILDSQSIVRHVNVTTVSHPPTLFPRAAAMCPPCIGAAIPPVDRYSLPDGAYVDVPCVVWLGQGVFEILKTGAINRGENVVSYGLNPTGVRNPVSISETLANRKLHEAVVDSVAPDLLLVLFYLPSGGTESVFIRKPNRAGFTAEDVYSLSNTYNVEYSYDNYTWASHTAKSTVQVGPIFDGLGGHDCAYIWGPQPGSILSGCNITGGILESARTAHRPGCLRGLSLPEHCRPIPPQCDVLPESSRWLQSMCAGLQCTAN